MEKCYFQPATLLIIKSPPWVFSRLLNCTNGTKTRKVSQILELKGGEQDYLKSTSKEIVN